MSGRFVRASKYRHVFGEASRKDKCYTGITAACVGDGNFIKANATFFAVGVSGGGGPLLIHRLDKIARLSNQAPVLNVHKCAVMDWDFSPFQENLIATGAEDGCIKITAFPEEGLVASVEAAGASLEGHQKKINFLHFHPTASNVLASSAYDNSLRIWDIEKQAQVYQTDFPEVLSSFEWNRNGSMIATSCKDKTVKIYDPRSQAAPLTGHGTQGAKGSRIAWLDSDKVAVVGFNAQSARQFMILDTRKMEEAVKTTEIDQGSGIFMSFFDFDNNILYLAGKGDGGVKYFEYEKDDLHFLSEFRTNESQKGFGFIAKRACDVKVCEIARGLRLMKDMVEPVSFQVPRKSDLFQEDIFPDAYAGVPALSADQYFAGENKEPPTVSMKPNAQGSGPKAAPSAVFKGGDLASVRSELEATKAQLEKANHEIAQLKEKLAKLGH